MKILDIKPNTPEWFEFRKDKIGASDCPIIMGEGYTSPLNLWKEKVGNVERFTSPAMQKGKDEEEGIRVYLRKEFGTVLQEIVVQSEIYDWMIASIDGYDAERNEITEIKTTSDTKMFKDLANWKPLPMWVWQMQHQMYVCGLQKCRLVVKCDGLYYIKMIERDPEMVVRLLMEEEKFIECVLSMTPPVAENPLPELTDPSVISLISEYNAVHLTEKNAERRKKEIKEELAQRTANTPFTCIEGKFVLASRKGTIQYKDIPELHGIDLEMYRGPATEYWDIKS